MLCEVEGTKAERLAGASVLLLDVCVFSVITDCTLKCHNNTYTIWEYSMCKYHIIIFFNPGRAAPEDPLPLLSSLGKYFFCWEWQFTNRSALYQQIGWDKALSVGGPDAAEHCGRSWSWNRCEPLAPECAFTLTHVARISLPLRDWCWRCVRLCLSCDIDQLISRLYNWNIISVTASLCQVEIVSKRKLKHNQHIVFTKKKQLFVWFTPYWI